MHIVYVIDDCNREGGQERYVAEMADRLGNRHEVHVYARTCRGLNQAQVRFHQVKVLERPIILKSMAFFARASALVRREAFDIVTLLGVAPQIRTW